jgi:predicted transcriptional regulator
MARNTITSISLPSQLSKEVDRVARTEHRTKSGVIQEAVRQYLELRNWQEAQREVSARARRLGLSSEDDVERIIDEVRSA